MATVTVGTTPVLLDDGSHAFVYVGNTGVTAAVLSTGATLQPFSSTQIQPRGVVLTARTLSGTTTLAVDITGIAPGGPGAPAVGDYADQQLSNLDTPAVARENMGLGDAARLDVGTGADTVAAGDDPRLSDDRDPTPHGADHGQGGGDPVTLAQSQITGLPAVLVAKADLVGGKVPTSQLPSLVIGETYRAANQAAMLALSAEHGDVAVREDQGLRYVLVGNPAVLADWVALDDSSAVVSVAGKTGVVQLVVADIGGLSTALSAKVDTNLGNVTAAAIRTKAELGDSATRNVGTTSGTVAAGNDPRIVNAASTTALAAVEDLAEEAQATADAAVPATALGQPDGVATLDGAGVIPAGQLAGRSPADFGAAPVQHTHALTDVPDAVRLLGSAILTVRYDEDAEQWPVTRAELALKPGQLVLWLSDGETGAEPPADADPLDWHAFDEAALPLPPVDPPDPPSSTRDVNGVVLNEPTFTVTGQTVNLTALLNTLTALTFKYLQFAVRRVSDQTNGDTGHTQNLAVNGDYTLTGSKAGLAAGQWTAALAYSLDGTTWFNGPATDPFTITAPTAPVGAQLVGLSGLPRNSGVFYQAGSRTAANAFADWRGRPLDAVMYFTGRDRWSDLMWFRDDLTSFPGYRVICVPFQPQIRNSQGATNPEGSNNVPTANGENNERWRTWAQAAKDKGWDDGRTIVRLSWENNGNWYDWGWGNPTQYPTSSGAIAAFTGAWTNVVNSIRQRTTKMLFDININRGNTRSGVNFFNDILAPLDDHYDIVGLDWYNHAPAQLSESEFNATAAQTYSGNDVHAHCVSAGKYMSLDEWFPSRGKSGAGGYPGGGDDPNWITRMDGWMTPRSIGNGGRLFMDISYNDPGAPSELMHSMYNPAQNPLAAARYLQLWGG
jgi:hypothetical protein